MWRTASLLLAHVFRSGMLPGGVWGRGRSPLSRVVSVLPRGGPQRWLATEAEEVDGVAHVDTCWSCRSFKKKRRSLFCVECKLIQPPAKDGSDFFELFGMFVQHDVDWKSFVR
jgi:hypothetical protein